MTYPTHDTDWATSAKGNCWRRKNGVVLVAGKRKDGSNWARLGEDYLPNAFASLKEAKLALEEALEALEEGSPEED